MGSFITPKKRQAQNLLGDMTPEVFLKDYWQKNPLVIKGAAKFAIDLMSPEELAGLSLEEQIESRIIKKDQGNYALRNGPFDDEVYASLPEENWTLLVQDVDKYLPQISSFKHQFDFIPSWRIEDVMISYAKKGGGVGPHFDHYDVFLIQTSGRREWNFSHQQIGKHECLEGSALRLIKDFKPDQTVVCEPGDILYIPYLFAHHGISLDNDCVTMSLGMNSVLERDIISAYMVARLQDSDFEKRFRDPDLVLQKHPSEISTKALTQLKASFDKVVPSEKELTSWIGEYLSEPKFTQDDSTPVSLNLSEFKAEWARVKELRKDENVRTYFSGQNETLEVFIGGIKKDVAGLDRDFVKYLLDNEVFEEKDFSKASDQEFSWILDLFVSGVFYFPELED